MRKQSDRVKLFVVGQWKSMAPSGSVWEFQGIFDSVEKAEEACVGTTYFVAPCVLNEERPQESEEWRGLYYPYFKDKI